MAKGSCGMPADRFNMIESPNCGLQSVLLAAGDLPILSASGIW
jgi:hypothetical protein